VALLAVVAALVPLAALDGRGGEAGVALAAADPAPPPPAPAPPAPRRPPKKPDPPDRPRVAWRESLALGTANAGRLVNGVRMPVEWPGLYTYDPHTQRAPGSPDRTWGTASLVREVLELGDWWARTYPKQPRLGIGDLSLEGGGPVGGHLSHENGLDVDIRLVRADGREAGVDAGSYDRGMNQVLVDRLVAQGASLVLIGPSLDLHGPSGVVMRWPNHDNHLHVRFPDPDGPGN
jgi:Penicillin-insensitive murein endopeptidase